MRLYGLKYRGKIIQHPDATQAKKEDLIHDYLYRHCDSVANAWFYGGLKDAYGEAKRVGYEIVRIKFVEAKE